MSQNDGWQEVESYWTGKQTAIQCPRCLQWTLEPGEWIGTDDRPDLPEGLAGIHLAVCNTCGYETQLVAHATVRRSLAKWQAGTPGIMA